MPSTGEALLVILVVWAGASWLVALGMLGAWAVMKRRDR